MLWEAVPRARRPRIHNPKHSVTRGESFSLSTGCNRRQNKKHTVRYIFDSLVTKPQVSNCQQQGKAIIKIPLVCAVAVFDPLQVHQTEGRGSDAGSTVVVVFIYVQVEGGVAIHVGRAEAGPQRFLHCLVGQPLLQFG